MIKFNCPACGKKIAVQDEHAGKKARCPGCKQTIAIPAQATQQDIPVAEPVQPIPAQATQQDIPVAEPVQPIPAPPPPPWPQAPPQQPAYQQQPVYQTPPPSAADSQVRCPKCGSTSITAAKKGYGAGKGCLGWLLAGPFGLLCGMCGANKMHSICMKCGHKWKLG